MSQDVMGICHATRDGSASRRAPVPPLTAEYERLRWEMRSFVTERLRPHADEWEADGWFPNEVFRWVADAGYLGLGFDDPVAAAVWVEELARCGSGGVAAGLGAHAGIALPPIAKFGTEEQKERYLAPGLRAELIAALAITEPGAGSDVAGIRTHARRVDGGYVVNGAKTFITGGVRADILVTAVKTTAEGGHRGISFLIIETNPDHPGVSASPLRKLGWHASDTAEIAFDDVFVPAQNLIGGEQ
jgi:acyl-CoA dehydrogenase